MSSLLLPGDPEFDYWLSQPPPGSRGMCYAARSGSGVLEAFDPDSPAFIDYIYGGEYDERLEEIGEE